MGYHDATICPTIGLTPATTCLQDHFYEAIHSWSQPSHLYIFSGWSAKCPKAATEVARARSVRILEDEKTPPYQWTDITYLLWQNGVSWAAYLDGGQGATFTHHGVQGIWNVLPGFSTVHEDGQLGNALDQPDPILQRRGDGTLPSSVGFCRNKPIANTRRRRSRTARPT